MFRGKVMRIYALRGAKVTAGFVISSLVLYGFAELWELLFQGNSTESSERVMTETVDQLALFFENFELDKNETSILNTLLDRLSAKLTVSLNELQQLVYSMKVNDFANEEGAFDKGKFRDYAFQVIKDLAVEVKNRGFQYFFAANSTFDEQGQYEFFNDDNNNRLSWPLVGGLVMLSGIFCLLAAIFYVKVRTARRTNLETAETRSFGSFFSFR